MLADLIIEAEVMLNNAKGLYVAQQKGDCAVMLGNLSVHIGDQLPGVSEEINKQIDEASGSADSEV